jgi:hypothetical protein
VNSHPIKSEIIILDNVHTEGRHGRIKQDENIESILITYRWPNEILGTWIGGRAHVSVTRQVKLNVEILHLVVKQFVLGGFDCLI